MITHPDKVLFPDDGITKADLAAYYHSVAPVMLPHLRRRPITMERFPRGIGVAGHVHLLCHRSRSARCSQTAGPVHLVWSRRRACPAEDYPLCEGAMRTETVRCPCVTDEECVLPGHSAWNSRRDTRS